MTRNRLIIPLVLLAVIGAAAVLTLTGRMPGVGEKGPVMKVVVDPVTFTDPFIVNLADTASTAYVKMVVAVQLEPMTPEDKVLFTEAAGGHGGSKETGAMKLAIDPVLRDAVITTVAKFDSRTLLTDQGKTRLKKALLAEFDHVAHDEAKARGGGQGKDKEDHTVGPPYHVAAVYLSDFAVQAGG